MQCAILLSSFVPYTTVAYDWTRSAATSLLHLHSLAAAVKEPALSHTKTLTDDTSPTREAVMAGTLFPLGDKTPQHISHLARER
ncbi:hypothetical protein BHE90_016939, partial [Fusarium euwallaceae]